MLHDLLGFFGIERGEFGAGTVMRTQKLVQFGVNSLGIAVLGALDKERHDPGCEGRDSLPIKCTRRKRQPQQDIQQHDNERGRM